MLYDVFICHASEDKDTFVRPLAEALRNSYLEVWYDEFSLVVGDSLRESIDRGLAKSRYGVVVLSPHFFSKQWPIRELNGLVAREMAENNPLILPIWHNISVDEIISHSPPLADRKAINSINGLEFVYSELLKKLRPDESPLIIARNELMYFGLNPPVVTDEWWLDVVEASNKIPCWGFSVPDSANWGRWTFPLPNYKSTGEARGVRLAWTALQMKWEEAAEKSEISQITRPEIVLDFIDRQPGLTDTCHDYPKILASYAPQLTIREFGGEFEDDFEKLLNDSLNPTKKLPPDSQPKIQKKQEPCCAKVIALRHEYFGWFEPSYVTCQFVQGDLGGPLTQLYAIFEYLIWLISSDSEWLPDNVRSFLVEGMKEWNTWASSTGNSENYIIDEFARALWRARNYKTFKLNKRCQTSLLNRIKFAVNRLNITDNPSDLLDNFINQKFIESYFTHRRK